MSQITVTLDPVALREATTQAIMGTLTPELREQVIRQAIAGLLQPGPNSYDRTPPLQKAFNDAVENVAREVAREYVKASPAIVDKLKELVRQAAEKMLSTDTDKLAGKMADAFCSAMRSER